MKTLEKYKTYIGFSSRIHISINKKSTTKDYNLFHVFRKHWIILYGLHDTKQ